MSPVADFEFDPERDYLLALCFSPRIGGKTLSRITEQNRITNTSPAAFFSMSREEMCERYGLDSRAAECLTQNCVKLWEPLAAYWRRAAGKPVTLLTAEDALYPERALTYCSSPPGFLFAYGNLSVVGQATFCVAQSRNPSDEALRKLEKVVEEGVLSGGVLVTGANTPAYKRGAVVPLRWGSPRILVLDRGLFAALGDGLDQEPFPAARLWRYSFDPEVDLVVSPTTPDVEYAPGLNRVRDELVFALSDRAEVIFASGTGRSRELAKRMEQIGRPVVWH